MGWLADRILTRPLPRFRPRGRPRLNARRREFLAAIIRERIKPVYVGDETVLCTILGRYKMYVDSLDHSLGAHLLVDGYWEMWVTEALVSLLRRRMVAVDVGANLGYFTLIMSEMCLNGHVHAFEPNPAIADRMRRTLVINGLDTRVTHYADPLGDADGQELHLIVERHLAGSCHLVEAPEVKGRPSLALHTRRLDGIVGAADAEIVKIDAEGSEPAIWRGMQGMLDGTKLHIVLLEFARVRYADPAGFLAEIARAGFSLEYVHEELGILPTTAEAVLTDPARIEWMLLLRR